MSAAVVLRFHSAEPGFAWWSHPREARVTRKEGADGGTIGSPVREEGGSWGKHGFPHARRSGRASRPVVPRLREADVLQIQLVSSPERRQGDRKILNGEARGVEGRDLDSRATALRRAREDGAELRD